MSKGESTVPVVLKQSFFLPNYFSNPIFTKKCTEKINPISGLTLAPLVFLSKLAQI